jgi:hypothetical protein
VDDLPLILFVRALAVVLYRFVVAEDIDFPGGRRLNGNFVLLMHLEQGFRLTVLEVRIREPSDSRDQGPRETPGPANQDCMASFEDLFIVSAFALRAIVVMIKG